MSQLTSPETSTEINLLKPIAATAETRLEEVATGPEVRFALSGGTNEVLIRLKKPVSKREFDRITKLLELAEDSFVENSSEE